MEHLEAHHNRQSEKKKLHAARTAAYQKRIREKKMALVPKGVYLLQECPEEEPRVFDQEGNEYPFFGFRKRPPGFLTATELRPDAISKARWVGMCWSRSKTPGHVFVICDEAVTD